MAAIMVTLQKSSVKFGNGITKLKQEKTFQILECQMESMRFEVCEGCEDLFKYKLCLS